jgi:8-oxo-dGTP diphosphatase
VHGDGNGWAECARGHRHWGVHGAAGLLLHTVDDEGVVRVLLQHRAAWSHHGGTWGLPGGARDSHEDGVAAALREAQEEAGLDRVLVRTRHTFLDDHGGWGYTTVYADSAVPLATEPNRESRALEWVALDEVGDRPLHPGFAATWPQVRVRPVVLVVDAANVVGSRPDGWWRDRAGATARLLGALADLRAVTAPSPSGETWVVAGVVAVLEGAARRADDPGWVQVLRTPHGRGTGGDDVVVDAGQRMAADGLDVVVVTADRGLRARLGPEEGTLRGPGVVGPRWLWSVVDRTSPPER